MLERGPNGDLHGFNLKMNRVRAVEGWRVTMFEDTERDLGRQALTVWRDFMQGHMPVVLRGWRDPLGGVGRKIGLAHGAAVGNCRRFNFVGKLTLVKGLAPAVGDQPQGLPDVSPADPPPDLGRGRKRRRETGDIPIQGLRLAPGRRGSRADRETVFRVMYGGTEQVRERQLAEALGQHHPGAHRARDGNRIPAELGHFAVVRKIVRGPGLGRAP